MKQYKFGTAVSPQSIERIARIGWNAFFTHWDPSKTEECAKTGAKNGLIYSSVHAPFSREARIWNGGEEGEKEVSTLISCIEDCARFDIPVVVLHTVNGFDPKTPVAPTQTGLDNYARIIEAGNKHGIKLAFENNENEKFLAAVMQKFWNEPCCGFCLDTGHEQCFNAAKDMMALYGEKLCYTHFNDNRGASGDTVNGRDDLHLVMGDGNIDWKYVMDRIDAYSYDGVLTCELSMRGHEDMPVDEFYALALDRMKKVAARQL